jgi:hypothetical protein
MNSKTASILALVIPGLVALIEVFSGQISALASAHPSLAVGVGAAATIVAALTKSVIPPKE